VLQDLNRPRIGDEGLRVDYCAAFTKFRNGTSATPPRRHQPYAVLLPSTSHLPPNPNILLTAFSLLRDHFQTMNLLSFLRRNKPKKLSQEQVEVAWEAWAQHVTAGTLAVHLSPPY